MRRICLALALISMLSVQARALDVLQEEANILQIDSLYDGLSEQVQEELQDISPTKTTNFAEKLWRVFTNACKQLKSVFRTAGKTAAIIMAIVTLCGMFGTMQSGICGTATALAGAFAITAVCAADLTTLIGLAQTSIQEISDFCKLLLPVLSSALAAGGGINSSGALYVGSSLFFNVLMSLVRSVLIPLVYAFVVLATAQCAVQNERLGKMREFIGWFLVTSMKTIMYLFTAFLSITGIISGSSDAMTLKVAKATLSGVLPVVGGIISDASESVLASTALLKNTAGVFGLLAVFAIAIIPFLRLGAQYLLLKLVTALSGTIAEKAHTTLLTNLTTAMGYMLSMFGCVALMAMICICCFLKAVSV